MAIKDTTAVAQEALTYDGIFLEHLAMAQVKIPTNTEMAQYGVQIMYSRYAVDSKGDRHYDNNVKTISISNLAAKAADAAAAGDNTYAAVLAAIQTAFAALVAEEEGIITTEV